LISISADSDDAPQLQIEDCEFSQDSDSYSTYSLSHSIISISGGIMKIERTTIENYEFMNGNSLINIKPNQASTVTIYGTSFLYIAQTGTGNGAAINAELNGASKLTIKEGCSFSGCQSVGSGGAIYAILNIGTNGGIFIEGTTLTTFSQCSASQLGGAIYLDISSGAEDKFKFDGASYSSDNEGLYGKSLFINAKESLRTAVPIGDPTRIKLGALNPETDFYNLMGYDGSNTLAIPLYYIYTAVKNALDKQQKYNPQ
ncbi:MAG: hypothetical protein EZS28_051104, partial [Streblomastix strix]